jgi:hypothetical protein
MSFVQSAFSTTQVGQTLVATYASAQTAGNLNVVAFWFAFGASITSVVDTKGNGPSGSYKLAYHLADGGTGDGDLWVYYAWNIAAASAGANSVTITFTGTPAFAPTLALLEESSIQSSSDPLRVANGAITTGATSVPTVSLTGTSSSDTIVGWSTSDNGQTSAGSPLVARVSQNFCVFEDGALSGGTVSVTTGPSDSPWNIIGAAFIAASGGTGVALATAIAGQATLTDKASVARSIADAVIGKATLTDNANVNRRLVDVIVGHAVLSDAVSIARGMTDVVVGSATLTDNAIVARALADTIVGRGTLVDTLSVMRPLATAIVARASVADLLAVTRSLTTAIGGHSILVAGGSFTSLFAVSIVGQASLIDAAAVARALTDAIVGRARLSATRAGSSGTSLEFFLSRPMARQYRR